MTIQVSNNELEYNSWTLQSVTQIESLCSKGHSLQAVVHAIALTLIALTDFTKLTGVAIGQAAQILVIKGARLVGLDKEMPDHLRMKFLASKLVKALAHLGAAGLIALSIPAIPFAPHLVVKECYLFGIKQDHAPQPQVMALTPPPSIAAAPVQTAQETTASFSYGKYALGFGAAATVIGVCWLTYSYFSSLHTEQAPPPPPISIININSSTICSPPFLIQMCSPMDVNSSQNYVFNSAIVRLDSFEVLFKNDSSLFNLFQESESKLFSAEQILKIEEAVTEKEQEKNVESKKETPSAGFVEKFVGYQFELTLPNQGRQDIHVTHFNDVEELLKKISDNIAHNHQTVEVYFDSSTEDREVDSNMLSFQKSEFSKNLQFSISKTQNRTILIQPKQKEREDLGNGRWRLTYENGVEEIMISKNEGSRTFPDGKKEVGRFHSTSGKLLSGYRKGIDETIEFDNPNTLILYTEKNKKSKQGIQFFELEGRVVVLEKKHENHQDYNIKAIDSTSAKKYLMLAADRSNEQLLDKLIQFFPDDFRSIGQEMIVKLLQEEHRPSIISNIAFKFEKLGGVLDTHHSLWLQIANRIKPDEIFKERFLLLSLEEKKNCMMQLFHTITILFMRPPIFL